MEMIQLIAGILRFYEVLLIIRILISWVMPAPRGQLLLLLHQVTDPYLNLFRRSLPFLAAGGIDFSPIAGFLLLDVFIRLLLG